MDASGVLRDHRLRFAVAIAAGMLLVTACTSGGPTLAGAPAGPPTASAAGARPGNGGGTGAPSASAPRPAGEFTMAFAGDVHFSGRVRDRLDRNPRTVFGPAARGLAKADLTMVNLETAVTDGGVQQNKEFTFRSPPSAFTALRDAGIDIATMANNHGADYGLPGLRDSLAASRAARFPVVGIGRNAAAAYAPYTTTLNGVRVAIIGADQVQDETTLRLFSATADTPGVANAYSDRLITAVRKAKAAGYVVVVYVHWGIEFHTCPSGLQEQLAGELADAGATAV